MQELFIKAGQKFNEANKILCISHKRPDGDTLGASMALYHTFKAMGKEVDLACIDDISERYFFLEGIKKFVKAFNYLDYDLICVSDAGASYMTKFHEIYPDLFSGNVSVINLDHHASNDNFGTINIVDVNSASTTVLIYKLFTFLNIPILPVVATALLCGIYNDTGSLMHGNTTLEVFEITGKLVELGGKVNIVAKNLFKSTPVKQLKVWGKVLERLTLSDNGVVASVITQNDLNELEAKSDDTSGVVDFMNAVPGSKFTVLLNEDEKGNVKGSFRTRRDDVDLAFLASKFGGGGHKKAAGFTMPGRIHQEIKWKVSPIGVEDSEIKQNTIKSQSNPVELLSNILQIPEANFEG